MKQKLEFPRISPDAWALTAPMQLDHEGVPGQQTAPCPWGYEMMGTPCVVEHVDGRQLAGQLLQWDPGRNCCLLRAAPNHVETTLPLHQLRLITLSEVLPPGSDLAFGGWGAVAAAAELQRYRVDTEGRLQLSGVALHHTQRPEGLYLSRRVSEAGASMRLFFPRRAVLHAEFQPLPMHAMDGLMNLETGPTAAGLTLLQPVCSAQALLQAVDLQQRQPVRRLGQILLGLGLISAEKLAQAISTGSADDDLPLGQRVVRQGLVSAQNVQRALHFKMGYPCVDLKHFAFDRSLLKTLPFKMATELDVLPLARTADGRLVVALDDPGHLGRLKPLQMLFNAPLVVALPWREPVQRMIPQAYGAGEIGSQGFRW